MSIDLILTTQIEGFVFIGGNVKIQVPLEIRLIYDHRIGAEVDTPVLQ